PPPPDRLIVEFEPSATSGDRGEGRTDAGTTLVRTLGARRFQLVRPQAGQPLGDALAALRADPSVKAVQRDGWSTPQSIPDDPLFGQEWGLLNDGLGVGGFVGAVAGDDIDVTPAWDRTVGSPSVVVADIDTGYRFAHADLGPVAWTNPGEGGVANGRDDDGDGIVDDLHGADFVGSSADAPAIDGDPTDDDLIDGGHGVHTAGTIGAAGNNGVGVTGVAQDVRIMPLRVCSHSPSDNAVECPYSAEVEAINYAGAHGARVANMSLGGTSPAPTVRDAMAENPNVLFAIAAGNDAEDDDSAASAHYPCVYDPSTSGIPGAVDNVICVAATDQADELASFSDWGASTVDLGAPGTETLSTFPQSSYFSDDFEAGDFASRWSATSGGGFRLSQEAPLTSRGITDSPGAAPPASTTTASTSPAFAVPADAGDCTLSGDWTFSKGSGSVSFTLLRDGSPFRTLTVSVATGDGPFEADALTGLDGASVQIELTYTSDSTPSANEGVWLDDVDLSCINPVSSTTGYAFLQGTSMATPHVSGAAALLFSLDPSASVTAVRSALLSSVDPDPALAGITTTGGRLDVAAAMDALVPISGAPPASSPTAPPASPQPPHPAVTQPSGHASPAATASRRCVVPKLARKTLAEAKVALGRAHCALGRVTKPRRPRHGRPPALVVKSSRPGAGAHGAAGEKVALTLKVKPKPKRRVHRR
ncbi:MAG TPA: S8 family serine peptidase, partial [Conexibacter sp.]|nr:S8 family serine peptidase [Conexibacter sp.]